MVKNIKIKICGQNNPAIINHCLDLNISYQGLIFYENGPRFINMDTLSLVNQYFKSHKDKFVGVFVNPSIDEIKNRLEVFDFDTIQLHGNEDQNFISEVKSSFKKNIYKSISPEDFKKTELIDVDHFLIEAKPSSNQMPGGNNKTWDWSDFKNIKKLPYILSGGLNVTNIKKAINLTGADFVDINSGVEEQPGEKSLTLIDGIISSIYN
jgi:phosphoribosylanthranilate isomerase